MNPKNTLIILSPGFAANEEDTTCLPPQQVFVKALNRNFPSLQIIILAFQYPRLKSNINGLEMILSVLMVPIKEGFSECYYGYVYTNSQKIKQAK